ncbi:MAG: MarR family winged helix-turn-helix transcriptional regulator [Filifactoraceae bacterium]
MSKYDKLKLNNQLCFPLYVCAKEVVRKYKPFLEELDLTYTQYIVMMVLWEQGEVTVKRMGELLYLDSGTLTPLLKKLQEKGYVTRTKNKSDERNLLVGITSKGLELKEKAILIPDRLGDCIDLKSVDTKKLYELLHQILENIK